MNKPPIGLVPIKIFWEIRLGNIHGAIRRYQDAGVKVPSEWLQEMRLIELFLGIESDYSNKNYNESHHQTNATD